MKKIIITLIVLMTTWAAIPWSYFGLSALDGGLEDYKLGLDLQG